MIDCRLNSLRTEVSFPEDKIHASRIRAYNRILLSGYEGELARIIVIYSIQLAVSDGMATKASLLQS